MALGITEAAAAGGQSTRAARPRGDSPQRALIMRALHAEGAKKGLSHEDLREAAGVASLSALSQDDLEAVFEKIAGRKFRAKHGGLKSKARRRAAGLAGGKRDPQPDVMVLVSAAELAMLDRLCDRMGWTRERLDGFIRRQLGERGRIRTVAEFNKVFQPLRIIWRRQQKKDAQAGKPAPQGAA